MHDILGPLSIEEFIRQYYGRLPLALPQTALSWMSLGDWQAVDASLKSSEADPWIVRRGEPWNGEAARSLAAYEPLHQLGYTLIIRHAERQIAKLNQRALVFQETFCGAVDVQLVCTPAQESGFGWHYDVEEVFIIQTVGSKEYYLRKNTVHPWPVLESMPKDLGYQLEQMPLIRCLLNAGDCLYIPSGYWHRAQALESSISLAIGIMPTTGLNLCDYLRTRLAESIIGRQRMSPVQLINPEECQYAFDVFATHVSKLLRDSTFQAEFVEAQRKQWQSRQEVPSR